MDWEDSLTIHSPRFPERYPNDANVTWIVSGSEGYNVIVTFQEFSLESGFDFLKIGFGADPTNHSTRLVTLTGASLPEDVVSATNEMWLRFTSDFSVTDKGFLIDVSLQNRSGYLKNSCSYYYYSKFVEKKLSLFFKNYSVY